LFFAVANRGHSKYEGPEEEKRANDPHRPTEPTSRVERTTADEREQQKRASGRTSIIYSTKGRRGATTNKRPPTNLQGANIAVERTTAESNKSEKQHNILKSDEDNTTRPARSRSNHRHDEPKEQRVELVLRGQRFFGRRLLFGERRIVDEPRRRRAADRPAEEGNERGPAFVPAGDDGGAILEDRRHRAPGLRGNFLLRWHVHLPPRSRRERLREQGTLRQRYVRPRAIVPRVCVTHTRFIRYFLLAPSANSTFCSPKRSGTPPSRRWGT